MKKIIFVVFLIGSFSAFANSLKLCQKAYESHHERLELILELYESGELSTDELQSRIKDSEVIFELSKKIMCKKMSNKKKGLI